MNNPPRVVVLDGRPRVAAARGGQGPAGPAGPPGSATSVDYPAADTVGGHRAVVLLASGTVMHCDPTVAAHAFILRGLSKNAAAPGDDVTVGLSGDEIVEGSWSWTPGEPVFVGLDGVLTQNPVVPGALFEISIGVAVSSTRIVLLLDEPIIL